MDSPYFNEPAQVVYQYEEDLESQNLRFGIALGDTIINAQTGVVLLTNEVERVHKLSWIDLSDAIMGTETFKEIFDYVGWEYKNLD